MDGVYIVIKNDKYLIILVSDIFILLLKLSSTSINKSFRVMGSIRANCDVSVSIIIFPCNRASHTLSGLSVDMIVGKILLFSFSIKFFIFTLFIMPSISILLIVL